MKRSTERHTGHLGFTLIELLLVVAIIGILCAIAIPGFLIMRSRVKNAVAQSDATNLIRLIGSVEATISIPSTTADWVPDKAALKYDPSTGGPTNALADQCRGAGFNRSDDVYLVVGQNDAKGLIATAAMHRGGTVVAYQLLGKGTQRTLMVTVPDTALLKQRADVELNTPKVLCAVLSWLLTDDSLSAGNITWPS